MAAELRDLRCEDSRRKLKRLIQRVILDVSFEDEERYWATSNSNSGANEPAAKRTKAVVETDEHPKSEDLQGNAQLLCRSSQDEGQQNERNFE